MRAMDNLARTIAQTPVKTDYIAMVGGVDTVTPPFQKKPGTLRSAQNFEAAINGGYRRIAGYERFSGQPKPSAAQYTILAATITGVPAVGNTLTGATSGATGYIIALPGSSFVMTKVVGTFQSGENLNVGGPTIAVAAAAPVGGGASSALLHAQYKNLAADVYRADIAAITGSGNVLGVHLYNDVTYAWRNNAGGTAAVMWKSTTAGWVQISFEYEVAYTAGSGAATIIDGGTLTQGGVTATIRRVLVRTGTLAAGSAAGTIVISVPAGGNFAAGAATVGAGTLTLSGAQTAITLAPGGRFECVNTNFGGAITTKRMYGCDGSNRAFEFDGSYFVPIPTGMTVDTPTHIVEHRNQLVLSFGASVQVSGITTPYTYSVVLGAAEISAGDTVTGFAVQPGSTSGASLAIFTRNRTLILYGSDVSDFVLVPYRDELGGYAHTIRDVGFTVFLDDRGVTDLQTSQSFGNFAHAVLSNAVRSQLNTFRTSAIASSISRDLSQYRLFFSNNYAYYITLVGRKVIGIMTVLYENAVKCTCSGEMADGSEAAFFGSDDGVVYEMDKGTSLDGDDVPAWLDLAYNFQGSPRVDKFYRDATVEIASSSYAAFSLGYSLGYGSTDIPQPGTETVTASFSSAQWDTFVWDAFFWDGSVLSPSTVSIGGDAENISLAITSSNDYLEPYTVTAAIIHYTPRRTLRH